MQRACRIAVAVAAFALLSGCTPDMLGGLLRPGESSQKNQAQEPPQRQRDPVNPMAKPEVGIDYDPRDWIANEYHPGAVSRMITSPGYTGMTQHTYAETGGDFNVHLDKTGERMLFGTTRYAQNPQICIQGVAARAVQLVTEDAMADMMPKFGPDGREIAWCSNRYGNWDILVQEAQVGPDSRPRQLTRSTEDDIHPSWSPDGRILAFSRFNAMDGIWQVWAMNYNTRTLSYITEGLFPEFRPTLDKTGQGPTYTIAYQRARKRDIPWYSVWTVDMRMGSHGAVEAVGSPREIVASDQWAAITPCWSPDGGYLAFATVRKSTLAQWQARIYKADDIYVVRIDGTDLTQITSHSAPDWDPWWAPDPAEPSGSGRLYFTSERNGVPNIWSVKPVVRGIVAQPTTGGGN